MANSDRVPMLLQVAELIELNTKQLNEQKQRLVEENKSLRSRLVVAEKQLFASSEGFSALENLNTYVVDKIPEHIQIPRACSVKLEKVDSLRARLIVETQDGFQSAYFDEHYLAEACVDVLNFLWGAHFRKRNT